jgi:hypothetical protein
METILVFLSEDVGILLEHLASFEYVQLYVPE